MKTRITLEQTEADGDEYRVLSLTNRFAPKVGTTVEAMLADDEELTVAVKKAR